MPPSMPRSAGSSRGRKRRSSARASGSETSVKTATANPPHQNFSMFQTRGAVAVSAPLWLPARRSAPSGDCTSLPGMGGWYLGAGHGADLGLHRNDSGLAAHAQFVDPAAGVFEPDAFAALLAVARGRPGIGQSTGRGGWRRGVGGRKKDDERRAWAWIVGRASMPHA